MQFGVWGHRGHAAHGVVQVVALSRQAVRFAPRPSLEFQICMRRDLGVPMQRAVVAGVGGRAVDVLAARVDVVGRMLVVVRSPAGPAPRGVVHGVRHVVGPSAADVVALVTAAVGVIGLQVGQVQAAGLLDCVGQPIDARGFIRCLP